MKEGKCVLKQINKRKNTLVNSHGYGPYGFGPRNRGFGSFGFWCNKFLNRTLNYVQVANFWQMTTEFSIIYLGKPHCAWSLGDIVMRQEMSGTPGKHGTY
ncbi:hypothetical protein LOAG_00482 [Loa loa]|uniref:Uncharacterized protein n=1 Tax=Loa loa TaxID=7209 RepID=A0A1S0UBE7_LOALO|nr:hypothetical protein LOAG_00482 [Loa loa]EFO28006.1 hypothetical protein LOAG_00482 [Loa loa]